MYNIPHLHVAGLVDGKIIRLEETHELLELEIFVSTPGTFFGGFAVSERKQKIPEISIYKKTLRKQKSAIFCVSRPKEDWILI